MANYTIAILGRPNVGKSTLFNRLIGTTHSIVSPIEGVTRDRVYGKFEWSGYNYNVNQPSHIRREYINKQ